MSLSRIDVGDEILVCIGVPGVGKSTIAAKLAAIFGICLLSTDAIRQELFGDEPYNSNRNSAVWNCFFTRLATVIAEGRPAILDITNAYPNDRRKLLAQVPRTVTVTGMWVQAPLQVILQRNADRADKCPVPEDVIRMAFMALETCPPRTHEFDSLLTVNSVTGEITRL
jgi:predicted kinase